MFETQRLYLRKMADSDADDIFKLRSDPDVMRYIRQPQKNRDESLNWMRLVSERWDDEKIGFCAVVNRTSGKLIGWCGLWKLKETGEIEIGYAISTEFCNQGYASEASVSMLNYGFDELSLDRIVAVAYPKNTASQNVMKKLGMSYDYTGEFYGRELVHYSISRAEWEIR